MFAKDYGRSEHYRPLQIKRTIERAGLDPIYSGFAIALFSGRDDLFNHHPILVNLRLRCNHAEIAHNHFSGDVNFDVGDIVNFYPTRLGCFASGLS